MAYPRKLDPAQITEIVARFQAGATLDALADDYGVTHGAISYHLRIRGVRRDRTEDSLPDPPPGGGLAAVLVSPGEWVEDALCAQTDAEAFFPEKGGSTRDAKAVCRRCPVAAECLDYALDNGERYGIWGGLSERERRKLQHGRALPARTRVCPVCDDTFTPYRADRVYCGEPCRSQAHKQRTDDPIDNPTEEVA